MTNIFLFSDHTVIIPIQYRQIEYMFITDELRSYFSVHEITFQKGFINIFNCRNILDLNKVPSNKEVSKGVGRRLLE